MILEVENGCFGYPKQKEILKNINLHLEKGHILVVKGFLKKMKPTTLLWKIVLSLT